MNKKRIILIVSALLLVLCAAGGIFWAISGAQDTYRIIKILSFTGEPVISRASTGDLDAYEGMVLESGDMISLNADSTMVLLMDDDKYAYAEDNTVFRIIAEGTSKQSKTRIEIERGVITCDVQNKLGDKSTYEITTPNSTIAIRGTVLTVMCNAGYLLEENSDDFTPPNGFSSYDMITGVTMWSGNVSINLTQPDGSSGNENIPLSAGEQILIGSDDSSTNILSNGDQENSLNDLIKGARTDDNLNQIQESGGDIPPDEMPPAGDSNSQGTCTIKYYANGSLFATQEVAHGDLLVLPTLQPDTKGKWDVAETSIGEEVRCSLVIHWK